MLINSYQEPQKPPRGKLSKEARKLWYSYTRKWKLLDADLALLLSACESLDTVRWAQRILKRDGLTVPGSGQQPKVHPCWPIERDSRAAMLKALKQLNDKLLI